MDGTSNQFAGKNPGQVVQAGHIGQVCVHAVPSPPSALAGLPPTTSTFRGRAEELRTLRAAWEAGGRSIVASGLAGIGKTEFVLHAAHQAVTEGLFPGGVLFVDLHGYDDQRRVPPGKALESFLLALGVPAPCIPGDQDQRSRLFRSQLTEQQTMLIVLDNTRSAEQIDPLLPGTPQHHVVITSRHTLSSLDARHIDVGLLDEGDAISLVGSAELARLCGRLPLALRIMKALLTIDRRADWASELRAARTRLDLLDDGDRPPVHAAFDLSYRSLTPEQQRLSGCWRCTLGKSNPKARPRWPDCPRHAPASFSGNFAGRICWRTERYATGTSSTTWSGCTPRSALATSHPMNAKQPSGRRSATT